MANFIKYLYRTCRKYFGEAWIVTQNLEDIISSPIIKSSIINNADTKIVLDLKKFMNRFDEIKEFLALSEHEACQVLSLNPPIDEKEQRIARRYKEVFVSFNGNYSNVYAVEVSKHEYFVFTTEQPEKVAVKRLSEHFGSLSEAVNTIVDEYGGDYKRAVYEVLDQYKTIPLQKQAS